MKRPAMAAWGLLLPTAWWREHTVGHCRNSLTYETETYNTLSSLHTLKYCWSLSNAIKDCFKKYFETELLSVFQSTQVRGRLQTEIIERLSISQDGCRRPHCNISLITKEAVGGRYMF